MATNNYSREIVVSNTPNATYLALTSEFEKWWTPGSNPICAVGDIVTFRFDTTYWKMHVINLVHNECIELECIDAHHIHEGLPETILKEWEGTKLIWKIQPKGINTKIIFVHEGLILSLECYDICETGWDFFFVKSLKDYLNTGVGSPGA